MRSDNHNKFHEEVINSDGIGLLVAEVDNSTPKLKIGWYFIILWRHSVRGTVLCPGGIISVSQAMCVCVCECVCASHCSG